MTWRRAGRAALLVLAALVALLAVRATRLRSRQPAPGLPAGPAITVDEHAVERLARALTFRTVSYQDPKALDADAFAGLRAFLASSFPRAHEALEHEAVGTHSLLFTWRGTNPSLRPMLFMAHMDVVPVVTGTESRWTHPPFGGAIADGYVWGRGALDDKAALMGLFEALEALLGTGFRPARTLYFAFGHDEEIGGNQGNVKIAALLASRGVPLEAVFDEGSGVTVGLFDGVSAPVAAVAVSEKGYLSLELEAESEGGHSSMPPPVTAVTRLVAALGRLDAAPFPARLTDAPRTTLEWPPSLSASSSRLR
jgi:carboxypeptidase PM20D1